MTNRTTTQRVLLDLWQLVASENCGCVSQLTSYQQMRPRILAALGLTQTPDGGIECLPDKNRSDKEQLLEALRFYADLENYEESDDYDIDYEGNKRSVLPPIIEDLGFRARKALEGEANRERGQ